MAEGTFSALEFTRLIPSQTRSNGSVKVVELFAVVSFNIAGAVSLASCGGEAAWFRQIFLLDLSLQIIFDKEALLTFRRMYAHLEDVTRTVRHVQRRPKQESHQKN